jgi:ketosteroid isomerase-like protein
MKKTTMINLLLAIVSATAFINPLRAQDASKELLAFTKKFQAIYNKNNAKALKEMYTDDAVRVGTDGVTVTGSDSIIAVFEKSFAGSKLMIEIKQEKVTTGADGSTTATGTYHVTGKKQCR